MVTHAAPPVRRLVLFKHGVAFLEHAGPVRGSFELAFDKDAMNDVLKSFALWVPSGDASVGAVAFDSPEDPEEALRWLRASAAGRYPPAVEALKAR